MEFTNTIRDVLPALLYSFRPYSYSYTYMYKLKLGCRMIQNAIEKYIKIFQHIEIIHLARVFPIQHANPSILYICRKNVNAILIFIHRFTRVKIDWYQQRCTFIYPNNYEFIKVNIVSNSKFLYRLIQMSI